MIQTAFKLLCSARLCILFIDSLLYLTQLPLTNNPVAVLMGCINAVQKNNPDYHLEAFYLSICAQILSSVCHIFYDSAHMG